MSGWDSSKALSDEQKQQFVDNGYLVVRDAVPPALVEEALSVIEQKLDAEVNSTYTIDHDSCKFSKPLRSLPGWANVV